MKVLSPRAINRIRWTTAIAIWTVAIVKVCWPALHERLLAARMEYVSELLDEDYEDFDKDGFLNWVFPPEEQDEPIDLAKYEQYRNRFIDLASKPEIDFAPKWGDDPA